MGSGKSGSMRNIPIEKILFLVNTKTFNAPEPLPISIFNINFEPYQIKYEKSQMAFLLQC